MKYLFLLGCLLLLTGCEDPLPLVEKISPATGEVPAAVHGNQIDLLWQKPLTLNHLFLHAYDEKQDIRQNPHPSRIFRLSPIRLSSTNTYLTGTVYYLEPPYSRVFVVNTDTSFYFFPESFDTTTLSPAFLSPDTLLYQTSSGYRILSLPAYEQDLHFRYGLSSIKTPPVVIYVPHF